MKRILLVGMLLISMFSWFTPQSVSAGHQILWWDSEGNQSFARFGPNATVSINTGTLEWACDTFFYTSNIYVVPSGSVSSGSSLTDVSGTPNTVQTAASGGLFIDEIIGFTAPGGAIGPGTYAVVYDECQNGIYDAGEDKLFDPAFEVVIPVDVPVLPAPEIAKIKADATEQAKKSADAAKLMAALMIAYDVYTFSDMGTGYQALINFYLTWICSIPEMPTIEGSPITPWCPTVSVQDTIRLQMAAVKALVDEGAHWEGIAADPPDPNFQAPAALGPRAAFQPNTDDPVESAVIGLGQYSTVNAAASAALLASLEKYQGAEIADDGAAALMHAQNVKQYSQLLAANHAETNNAVDTLLAELQTSGRDLEGLFDNITLEQDRVAADGFSSDETRLLKNLGLTDADLTELEQAFVAGPFNRFQDLGGITTVLSGLKTQNTATAATLQELASAMDANISALVGQGVDVIPHVQAGGPYNGVEGTAIVFDGSGSTDPKDKALTYEWDLDSDGAFDDATGVSPSHTYTKAFTGQIGLKVTNSDGRTNVAYAPIAVTDINAPPSFTTVDPSGTEPIEVEVGSSQIFSAAATDPDGDPVTLTWMLNGVDAGSGGTFSFDATADNGGVNVLTVRASDGHPLGGSTALNWLVKSLYPDTDVDGWRANVDCDDTDPDVNPGATEVVGNGKDDDCDPSTSDVAPNDPPTAVALASTQSGVAPLDVTFDASESTDDGSIQSYAWDFGDGATGTGVEASHTYTTPGTYTATLTVTDDQGATDTDTIQIQVDVPDNDGDGYDAIEDCDDNDPDVNPGATEIIGNGKDDDCDPLTQDNGDAPTALFNPVSSGRNVALLEGGATVHSRSSQYDGSHSPQAMLDYQTTGWPWASGNGQTTDQWVIIGLAEGKTYLIDRIQLMPRTAYADQRVRDFAVDVSTTTTDDAAFTTVLTATAENNGNLQEFVLSEPVLAKYVRYRPLNNRGSTCCISTQQFKVLTGQHGGEVITFQDHSSDVNDDIVSWHWDFGDGSTSTEASPTHDFTGPGTYTVTLTVTDSAGNESNFSLEQRVLAPPTTDFTFNVAEPNEGQSVTFTGTASDPDGGTILRRTWHWGDGTSPTTTTSNSVPHTFHDNGSYTVTFEVMDSQEQVTQIQKTVTVRNVAPTVNVGRDRTWPDDKLLSFTVSITDPGSRDGNRTCLWDFGDGSPTASTCNFNHSYPEVAPGDPPVTYTATLTVTDKDGGVGSDSLNIVVGNPDVLILGTTVRGGVNSQEFLTVESLGMIAEIADASSWGAKTTADFASYKTIIFGDPDSGSRTLLAAAEANKHVWGPAITGNVILIGTDAVGHYSQGGSKLVNRGIAFAADEPGKTGAFITLSEYYHNTAPETPVPVLDAFAPGGFTVRGVGCYNDAHIVAAHPALDELTDRDLSNWGCSVHEAFDSWPSNFLVLAIARGVGAYYTAPDGSTGTPYILARGEDLSVISDITLSPKTASSSVGSSHTLTAAVAENDVPTPGRTVTYTVTEGPHAGTTGTAVTDDDGQATFSYTSTAEGTDSIIATFVDSEGKTQTSNTVTAEWVPVANHAPVATDQSVVLVEDTPIGVTLTASDPDDDELTYVVVDQPTHGTISGTAPNLTYTPGPNYHGSDSFTFKVNDGLVDSNVATVTIIISPVNDAPSLSNDGPKAGRQYSDPIESVTISATDVDSATETFTVVSTSWRRDSESNVRATPLPDGLSLVPGETSGTWVLQGKSLVAPGTYVVMVTVSDGVDTGTTEITLTVIQEDARATYTGALFVSTSSVNTGMADVTLSATVQDITALTADQDHDADAGDIRNATLTFMNRESGATLCTAPIGLVDTTDAKTGTATCTWNADIGNASSDDLTVGIVVGGYYIGDEDRVITISKPQDGFITGGGYLVLQESAGLYPGGDGTKTNYGFNVKFNKQRTNLQGNITITVRNEGRVYQIKSDAISSLVVDAELGTATVNATASIQDVTDELNPVSIDENAPLQMTLTDRGEPGDSDTIGFTLWNKNGGLWYTSNWDGSKTVEQTIEGGNLVIH